MTDPNDLPMLVPKARAFRPTRYLKSQSTQTHGIPPLQLHRNDSPLREEGNRCRARQIRSPIEFSEWELLSTLGSDGRFTPISVAATGGHSQTFVAPTPQQDGLTKRYPSSLHRFLARLKEEHPLLRRALLIALFVFLAPLALPLVEPLMLLAPM